ncbi:acyltransferase family protein [Maribacter halichondriae]|uniref:acyltransferase family protein n=1 Tax=Maribacter halichondriae TaxID=2980554 RepID=UPI0030764887
MPFGVISGGITAPVFFTVSGFIYTYLLIRVPQKGLENPRVKKGIKRGLELLLIGYLLRMNLFGLLKGEIYDSFFFVDVLHCIGLSILGIIGVYLLTQHRKRFLFPSVLVGITVLLFLFEPLYKSFSYGFLPDAFANYFTKANGSVFTIFPWFGYASFGAFLSILFTRFKNFKHLYPIAMAISVVMGSLLIFFSSDFFLALSQATGIQLFADIFFNNYLFIRLGDVFLVFAVFMLFRSLMTNKTMLAIGSSTLSIYVVHFIILYGSFTGLGLYGFFHHSLSPMVVIPAAILFMVVCTYLALQYEKHKVEIKSKLRVAQKWCLAQAEVILTFAFELTKNIFLKVLRLLGLVKN